jgi:hypothetical protein
MSSMSSSDAHVLTNDLCDSCLQYREDCECCPWCGGVDFHEYSCSEGPTKRVSAILSHAATPRARPTLRSPGNESETPIYVFRIDSSTGAESTGTFQVRKR